MASLGVPTATTLCPFSEYNFSKRLRRFASSSITRIFKSVVAIDNISAVIPDFIKDSEL